MFSRAVMLLFKDDKQWRNFEGYYTQVTVFSLILQVLVTLAQ
jgi:hypothetical protein